MALALYSNPTTPGGVLPVLSWSILTRTHIYEKPNIFLERIDIALSQHVQRRLESTLIPEPIDACGRVRAGVGTFCSLVPVERPYRAPQVISISRRTAAQASFEARIVPYRKYTLFWTLKRTFDTAPALTRRAILSKKTFYFWHGGYYQVAQPYLWPVEITVLLN
jgi:hypothetical protein